MSTTVIPRLPTVQAGTLHRIGSAVLQLLAFNGNAMAGRYGSPRDHTHDAIDEGNDGSRRVDMRRAFLNVALMSATS